MVAVTGHGGVSGLEFLRWGNSSLRMVTGTFTQSEGLCGNLKLKGETMPLGVTPGHPVWSEDRQDWVPVGELVPGETVKTFRGTTTVESYTMRDMPEPVFNLEVEGDHVYRVGDQGVLVHNASCPKSKCKRWNEAKNEWEADPGLPEHKPAIEFYAELYMKDTIPIGTGASSKFTSGEMGQIVKIIALNRKRNDGVVKSDDPADPFQILRSGPEDLYREEIAAGTVQWEDERMRFLVWVTDGRRVSLVTLPGPTTGDERRGRQVAVVDHIRPKDKGGSNSYCNARVISKALNSIKGNR